MTLKVDRRKKGRLGKVGKKAPRKFAKKMAKKTSFAHGKTGTVRRMKQGIAAPFSAKHPVVPPAGKVESLRTAFGMTRTRFARLVGNTDRSIANWETGASAPKGLTAQRLEELERLKASLGEVIEPASIGPWLETPNPAFGGLKPIEVIERGEMDRLWKMIFELQSGSFS